MANRNIWFLIHYKKSISLSKFDIVHRNNIVLNRRYIRKTYPVIVKYGAIRFTGKILLISGSKGYIRRNFHKICRKYLKELYIYIKRKEIKKRDKKIQCKIDEDSHLEIENEKIKLKNHIHHVKLEIEVYKTIATSINKHLTRFARIQNKVDKYKQMVSLVEAKKVEFGLYETTVPDNVYINLNWSCHIAATRDLVVNIFDVHTLATHSLKTPDFKAILEIYPNEVSDIIEVVSSKCSVPQSCVKNCILYTCADMTKIYKNRLNRKKISGSVETNKN